MLSFGRLLLAINVWVFFPCAMLYTTVLFGFVSFCFFSEWTLFYRASLQNVSAAGTPSVCFLWRTEAVKIFPSFFFRAKPVSISAPVSDVMSRAERNCSWMLLELVFVKYMFLINPFPGPIFFFYCSSRASDDRGGLYFVCTHCCHNLLCFNRAFLIIKRDDFSGCWMSFFNGCQMFSSYTWSYSAVQLLYRLYKLHSDLRLHFKVKVNLYIYSNPFQEHVCIVKNCIVKKNRWPRLVCFYMAF